MTAQKRFEEALTKVESDSIRDWAQKNSAAWINYIDKAIKKSSTPEFIAMVITAEAIGLW
jgi:hypothetical protein